MKLRGKGLNLFILLLFAIVFQIVFSASLFGVVEIIIEYNITQNCTGNVLLTLSPSTVIRGGSVTPSASGLSACGGYRVYFRNVSCTGVNISQCTVPSADGGCTGSAFSAPSTLGSYTYYACIDKNNNTVFTDPGESDSKTLTVVSAIPSVGSLTFNPSVVDLIEETVKKINVSATITDDDGASDISSCRGYLWNSTTAPPLTIANARYTNSSCSLSGCSGNSCLCTCTFGLMYYDVNGTWTGNITATDKSNVNGTNRGNFTVNPKLALSVANLFGPVNSTNFPIQFAVLYVGDVNRSSSSNPLKINNTGNAKMKLKIYGSDHVGKTDPTWVLKVGNMTYNSSATGMGTLKRLTNTSTDFYPSGGIPVYPALVSGITEPATFHINNYLSIPTEWKAQTYSGTYYLEVEMV